MPQHQLSPFPGSDPGPSTHPRGPPNLNQMSVVAPPQSLPQNPLPGGQRRLRTPPTHRTSGSDGSPGDAGGDAGMDGGGGPPQSPHESGGSGRTRGGRAAGMSNDEWARQRKDNHVSVSFLYQACVIACYFLGTLLFSHQIPPSRNCLPLSLMVHSLFAWTLCWYSVAMARDRAYHLVPSP